ncbi:MAG TPA: tetratricopeptide repeat protein [Acidobacteriaceae bacterium]|nr:tetratricopeptide repeat protein [Acidobacteriaceae bacterium]
MQAQQIVTSPIGSTPGTRRNPAGREATFCRALMKACVRSVVLVQTGVFVWAQSATPGFAQVSSSAEAARQAGDLPRAILLYQDGVRLNPQWSQGWWYLGALQYGANSYASAADALTHYLALMPKAGPAFALRGQCEFEEGQFSDALKDLAQAVSLGAANDPRNAGILHFHEALLLTRLGRFEEALGQYGILVRHGALSDDVITGLGLAGLRMPILPQDIDPSQRDLVTAAGGAASSIMRGDFAAGRQGFELAFSRFPAAANLHYFYGYLLFNTDPDGAIAQFRDELAVNPSGAVDQAMLAWALGMQGEYAAALQNAEKSAAEDPSLGMAQLVLGRDLLETGHGKEALPHIEAALKIEPANLEVHLALAKVYSELGQREDARRERLVCLSLEQNQTGADANM